MVMVVQQTINSANSLPCMYFEPIVFHIVYTWHRFLPNHQRYIACKGRSFGHFVFCSPAYLALHPTLYQYQ